MSIAVAELKPSRAKSLSWSWDDEAASVRTRQCMCCGKPGHYQETVEQYMKEHCAVDRHGRVKSMSDSLHDALSEALYAYLMSFTPYGSSDTEVVAAFDAIMDDVDEAVIHIEGSKR